MSALGKAVFLSYASQDEEVARRVCDTLRAFGVEVWFDQSELRGGDARDASIRRQSKDCALFTGRRTESDTALQELIAKYQTDGAYQVAEVYGSRGEADLAFDWLEQAYVQRDTGLADMKISPPLRSLHADPRWSAFPRKMGLAD